MIDPLQVLLLTSGLSPAAGGLAVSVPGLAHSIDPLDGIEMHVMGTYDRNDPASATLWGPKVHAFNSVGPAALHYTPKMRAALSGLSPGVIDVQGLWTYPSLANLLHTRRTGIPYLVTPRGMLDPWARENSALKKRIVGKIFEYRHLKNASAVRATAEMEAEHFRNFGLTNPIAIVPNGLNLPALAPRRDTQTRSILFLSRIHPKKGVDFLLRSWAALHADFPDCELVIAGIDENGHEAELKRLSNKLKLPRVRFVGSVHGAEKQALYRDADLFVLPTHAENFGLVVAEALAQNTPVITTKNAPWGGLKDHDCGWWIALDQNLLTETMRAALVKPSQELETMGKRGREWISRDFSMDQVAQKMRAVYLWAAHQGPKPDTIHE